MIRIGKHIIRNFSPLWWVLYALGASAFVAMFLLVMNLVGGAV